MRDADQHDYAHYRRAEYRRCRDIVTLHDHAHCGLGTAGFVSAGRV